MLIVNWNGPDLTDLDFAGDAVFAITTQVLSNAFESLSEETGPLRLLSFLDQDQGQNSLKCSRMRLLSQFL